MNNDLLAIWTIYFNTPERPQGYMARKFLLDRGKERATHEVRMGTLEQLRESFGREGLVLMARDPSDDPVIVESWL